MTATAEETVDIDARRRAFVDGLFFRVIACTFLEVVILATAIASGLPLGRFAPPMLVVAFVAALDGVYWMAAKRRGFPMGDFYAHWFVDLLCISFIIYWLGAVDLPYGPFIYSMIVITSAIFMSRRGAYIIAGGAALCLIVMAAAVQSGVVPPPLGVWSHHFSPAAEVAVVIGAVIFFFMNAYLAGTLSDQLKIAKAHIEDQNRFLEQRVSERTQQLEARTSELQERTEELEEMVHIMTHDLQNVAVASTETTRKLVELDGGNFSPRGQRYADRLLRDCRLMATMLRNLLEVVSATEIVQRRQVVDVAGVVRDAVARAHTAVESKGIDIQVHTLPPLYADHQKIQHVFENLLSNACKYVGDKPNPRIEVGGTAHRGTIEYYVKDNGVGIEPTQMGRIFQLYHRAPDQVVAGVEQQGHGIGLAVVKRIVQRYGGKIWVESTPGEGSTFRLTFPSATVEPVRGIVNEQVAEEGAQA